MTRAARKQPPGPAGDHMEGGQMVSIDTEELRRVTVFFLRESAERIAALAQEAQKPTMRARLLALARDVEEQARLLEEAEV